jgi:hypothetical protein
VSVEGVALEAAAGVVGPYALWVSPSDADRHVYVQGPDGVERWPRPTDPIYCA